MVQEKKGQFQIATALPDTAQGVLPSKDVKGLRQLADSAQLFGRLTTFLQSLGTKPALLMAFDSKYDVVKYMDDMMRAIRLDPSKYEKPPAMQAPGGIDPNAAGVPTPPAQAG